MHPKFILVTPYISNVSGCLPGANIYHKNVSMHNVSYLKLGGKTIELTDGERDSSTPSLLATIITAVITVIARPPPNVCQWTYKDIQSYGGPAKAFTIARCKSIRIHISIYRLK